MPETDPAVWAHKLFARALGGGMSSPLFQEVREKRGLVYSVHAGSDHGRDNGDVVVSAGTTAQHVEELLDVACGEITKAAARIAEPDLQRARNASPIRLAKATLHRMALRLTVSRGRCSPSGRRPQ